MALEEIKQALRNRAATFYLSDGEFPIEEQLVALEDASPREVHVKGVEPCTEYEYCEVKVLLQYIDELHQDFLEVYEKGYKDARLPWQPNIQYIERPV